MWLNDREYEQLLKIGLICCICCIKNENKSDKERIRSFSDGRSRTEENKETTNTENNERLEMTINAEKTRTKTDFDVKTAKYTSEISEDQTGIQDPY